MRCTIDTFDTNSISGYSHDWVLVSNPRDFDEVEINKLLWACPCGEFKWTSYAEWDAAKRDKELADLGREHPVGTAGIEMTPEKWQEAVNHMKRMTSNPNQGESTAAGHITP